MRIWRVEDRVHVVVRFDKTIVEQLKTIGSGYWSKENRCWIFPQKKETALRALSQKIWIKEQQMKKWMGDQPDDRHSTHNKTQNSSHSNTRSNGRSLAEDTCIEERGEASARLIQKELLKMRRYLDRKGYSPQTIKSYMSHLQRFLVFTDGHSQPNDIDNFVHTMLVARKVSHTYVNQSINAIKLYLQLCGKEGIDYTASTIRPKSNNTLPKVLSPKEVKALFDKTTNLKHKTMLMLAYSCGMRVSEVAMLKVKDVDSARMVVQIEQSKGNKDRIVPLSPTLLEQLRSYYVAYTPEYWLFQGRTKSEHIHPRSIQKVFNKAKEKAGIRKKATFHSLRHSYATHMLENGIDLRFIQELLGHKSSKTTEIYTHVSTKSLQNIVNPLDRL